MATRIKLFAQRWTKRTFKPAAANLLAEIGEAVVQRVKENIDTNAPPHSTPGEFPHRITGELQESVGMTVDEDDLTVEISATAPHAGHVQKIRPFIDRTIEEMVPELNNIITHR